jgi:molybdopterin molybdotransferase
VGDKDIMHDVLKLLGAETLFWRIACKPGKAVLFARYKGKVLACLSGNPFAAYTNFELLVKPALAKLAHRKDLEQKRKKAFLGSAFNRDGGTRRFVRGTYNADSMWVSLPDKHSSGQIYSFLGCNCLVDIPPSSAGLSVGSEVEVILL